MTTKQLKERLRAVPDSYSDFVEGVPSVLKTCPGLEEKLVRYLDENPEATTDDITDFIYDEKVRLDE